MTLGNGRGASLSGGWVSMLVFSHNAWHTGQMKWAKGVLVCYLDNETFCS